MSVEHLWNLKREVDCEALLKTKINMDTNELELHFEKFLCQSFRRNENLLCYR